MFTRFIVLASILVFLSTTLRAQTTMQLDVGLWDMSPGGSLSVGSDREAGSELDLDGDLGFDGSEKVWQVGTVVGATHQLAISYLAFDADARKDLAEDIRFGDAVYPVGTRVKSSLQGDFIGASYRYAGGTETLRSGFSAGLEMIGMEAVLSSEVVGKTKGDISSLLPVVGVFAEWNPAVFLQLSGSVQGGAWDWSRTSLTFLDAEASARVLLFPFFAGIGYRHIALQGDDTSLPMDLDFTFSGPAWFAGIIF